MSGTFELARKCFYMQNTSQMDGNTLFIDYGSLATFQINYELVSQINNAAHRSSYKANLYEWEDLFRKYITLALLFSRLNVNNLAFSEQHTDCTVINVPLLVSH